MFLINFCAILMLLSTSTTAKYCSQWSEMRDCATSADCCEWNSPDFKLIQSCGDGNICNCIQPGASCFYGYRCCDGSICINGNLCPPVAEFGHCDVTYKPNCQSGLTCTVDSVSLRPWPWLGTTNNYGRCFSDANHFTAGISATTGATTETYVTTQGTTKPTTRKGTTRTTTRKRTTRTTTRKPTTRITTRKGTKETTTRKPTTRTTTPKRTTRPGICQYSRSLDILECWDNSGRSCQSPHKCASCSTIQNVFGGGKLPVGTFRIGTFYAHGGDTPWFNLYPKRQDGGFWDYNSKSPDFDCRGGFGLHPGSVSLGCVTVSDESCFEQVKAILNSAPIQDFTATECKKCVFSSCIFGTNTISAKWTGVLTVVE